MRRDVLRVLDERRRGSRAIAASYSPWSSATSPNARSSAADAGSFLRASSSVAEASGEAAARRDAARRARRTAARRRASSGRRTRSRRGGPPRRRRCCRGAARPCPAGAGSGCSSGTSPSRRAAAASRRPGARARSSPRRRWRCVSGEAGSICERRVEPRERLGEAPLVEQQAPLAVERLDVARVELHRLRERLARVARRARARGSTHAFAAYARDSSSGEAFARAGPSSTFARSCSACASSVGRALACAPGA